MNTHKEVLEIISKLNQLNDGMGVDGETMQYILGQVGMEWQMLRQLMLTMPMEQVKYLLEEKKDLFPLS